MSKKPKRDANGRVGKGNTLGLSTRFGPGNDASKGHGRPPDRVKAALADILDQAWDKDPEKDRKPLSIEAVDVLRLALRSRDERGHPTMTAVAAAAKIMEHRWGKPRQTTEINVSSTTTIETVRRVMVGLVAEDARAAITDASRTPR